MVLEALLNPSYLVNSYLRLGIVGAFYALIAGFLAYLMFRPYASIVMVFFTIMVCIPFMYALLKKEEEEDDRLVSEVNFIDEYQHVTLGLVALFLGVTAGYLVLYLVLPGPVHATLFSAQESTITAINGNMVTGGYFLEIFFNNLSVLGLSLALAFLYGFGAITIIVWNSSVLAAALGHFITTKTLATNGLLAGFQGLFRYLLHGIPEIAAYLVAGLAGGIISFAIINHHVGTKRWRKIVYDAGQLAVLSILLLVIGALVEVFITPWFY